MYKDVTMGAVFLALSVAMFGLTFRFPDQTIALPPTYFPRFVCVCMAVMAGLLILRSWPRPAAAPEPAETGRPPVLQRLKAGPWPRIAAMAALAFAYTETVDSLGYLLATGLFLAGSVVVFMERRPIVVLPVAVVGTGALYWVFRMVFKVPLPRFDLF